MRAKPKHMRKNKVHKFFDDLLGVKKVDEYLETPVTNPEEEERVMAEIIARYEDPSSSVYIAAISFDLYVYGRAA